MPENKRRGPGRPSGDADLKRRLLDTAREEFAAHGFNGTAVGRIAKAAGATPAMTHYYFGDKNGLYQAMLEDTFGPLLEAMRTRVNEVQAETDPLPLFLRSYMGQLAARPEIPVLLVQDVLRPGAEMRATFVRDFARHGAAVVRGLIQRGQEAGRVRPDLDPDLAALSLLSLAAFPFLGAPVATEVLDYGTNPEDIDRLVDHTLDLFRNGAGVPS